MKLIYMIIYKDVQACGAAMQNVLLCIRALGIGSCWNGELISKEIVVKNFAGIENDKLELMGVVSLGYTTGRMINSCRKNLESFLL